MIQVIDRRKFATLAVNSIQEVPMFVKKVRREEPIIINAKVIDNPKEEKVMKTQPEKTFTLSQVKEMIENAVSIALTRKAVPQVYEVAPPTKHKEEPRRVIRIDNTPGAKNKPVVVQAEVQEVKHSQVDAGIKAYATRIQKQVEPKLQRMLRGHMIEVGQVFPATIDKNTPMAKECKVKLDKVKGRTGFFRVKVAKRDGSVRYVPIVVKF